MAKFDDRYPMGHYFVHVVINVGGKRNYKLCAGSGCSSRIEDAIYEIEKLPGVVRATYRMD